MASSGTISPQKSLEMHRSRYDCASDLFTSGRVLDPEKIKRAEVEDERRESPAWMCWMNVGVSSFWKGARSHSFSSRPWVGPPA